MELFYGLIQDPFYSCFMAGLWPVLWPNWGLFCACFMAGLWIVLWPGLGLFWDYFLCPVLWLVCGLPCGRLGLFCEHFTFHIWP